MLLLPLMYTLLIFFNKWLSYDKKVPKMYEIKIGLVPPLPAQVKQFSSDIYFI